MQKVLQKSLHFWSETCMNPVFTWYSTLLDFTLTKLFGILNFTGRKCTRRLWGGGGRTRVNYYFLVGPKDPKISALTNFFGLIFQSHMKPNEKATFLSKH